MVKTAKPKKEKKESRIQRLKKKFEQIYSFITHDIWVLQVDELSPKLKAFYKYLRVGLLALRGFNEKKVSVKASALTYYTLMSIVPIFAMVFGIAKGFGLDKFLEQQIRSSLEGQEEVMNKLITFSSSLLERTGGGIIAGIGVVLLFWSVVMVLSSIENAFNDIWQIEKPRTYVRKFTDYLSIMVIAPILLLAASGIQIYLSTQVSTIAEKSQIIHIISPVLLSGFKLVPYLLIWILFSFLFITLPNTKVSIVSGIIAGILSGTAFLIVQWAYVYLQIGVSKYNAIYGSFAALPLFLVWVHTSWLIVLFGAEVSFAYQNVEMYEFEKKTDQISHFNRKVLSILILNTIIKRFNNGEEPLTSLDLSKQLKIPQRLMRNLLTQMVECGFLNEVVTPIAKNYAYQPARHIDHLTLAYIEDKLDNHGLKIEPNSDDYKHIAEVYRNFNEKYKALSKETLIGSL